MRRMRYRTIEEIKKTKKHPKHMALTNVFETGIKHPIMQPIDGNEPAIGCLVSFEYGYCYNK